MSNSLLFLFHLAAVVNFAYGIYYDLFKLKLPDDYHKITIEWAGRWKYLTFWNMVLQLGYFSFSLINDLFGSHSLNKKDRKLLQVVRDYLFGSLVFPLGLFVATTFWALWAINRELVFPAALDAFFPAWLNHIMHTSIVPLDFVELLFTPKTFPQRAKALTGLAVLMLGYLVWVFIIAFKTNFWVYPILAVLNWGYRILFIVGLVILVSAMYFTGEKLHSVKWGQPQPQVTTKATKPTQKLVKENKSPSKLQKSTKEGRNKRKQN